MLDRLKNVEPGMPYIDLPLQTIEGKRGFFIDIYRQREIYSPRLFGHHGVPLSKTNSLFKTIIRTI